MISGLLRWSMRERAEFREMPRSRDGPPQMMVRWNIVLCMGSEMFKGFNEKKGIE